MIKNMNRVAKYGLAALLTATLGFGSFMVGRNATRMLAQRTPVEQTYVVAEKQMREAYANKMHAYEDWANAWIDPNGLAYGYRPTTSGRDLNLYIEARETYMKPFDEAAHAAEKSLRDIVESPELQNALKNRTDAETRKNYADAFSHICAIGLGGIGVGYLRRKREQEPL